MADTTARIADTQFSLTISIGNDAMQTKSHIADALRDVVRKLEEGHSVYGEPATEDKGPIYDANGNRVGNWNLY